MKRSAGKADPVAEVYSIVTKQRRAFEAHAFFKKPEIAIAVDATETRLQAHRAEILARFCVSDLDTEYERIHGGAVTEAHHAAEEMRLPTTSARQDAGKTPGGLLCSSRLP